MFNLVKNLNLISVSTNITSTSTGTSSCGSTTTTCERGFYENLILGEIGLSCVLTSRDILNLL